ncbi:hypothetical protein KIH41_04295 [Litoribacter ruber]|uniref:hypothetical protein n=1 Tax=Litoribacter ruber TaxID=702568 RepID=UPI001BDB2DE5|nr:hypothetical protein [Litoribacter ruber]MBT0810493.1 hypothetical protein [Litoribacter ruber]
MKKLLATAFFFVLSLSLYAQKDNNSLNAGLEVGLPVGIQSSWMSVGIGATAKGLYGVGEAGQVSATLGFIRHGYQGSSTVNGGVSMIPIMGGYRHHFESFYGEAQLGLAIVNSAFRVEGFGASGSTLNGSVAIGGGFLYEDFDFSVRYQGYGTGFNTLGLRVAYRLPVEF